MNVTIRKWFCVNCGIEQIRGVLTAFESGSHHGRKEIQVGNEGRQGRTRRGWIGIGKIDVTHDFIYSYSYVYTHTHI